MPAFKPPGSDQPAQNSASSRLEANFEASDTLSNRPAITLNVERYIHHLADSGLAPDQIEECIRLYWDIVVQFVYLGFDLKTDPTRETTGNSCTDLVKCSHSRTKQTAQGTAKSPNSSEEGVRV